MRNDLLENDAKCSARAGFYFSIFSINIFGIILTKKIRKGLLTSKEVRISLQGWMKFWFILSQAYFIVVFVILFGVLCIVLKGNYPGLIGILVPETICCVAGFWYVVSAFLAYEKTYLEPDFISNHQKKEHQYQVYEGEKSIAQLGQTDGYAVNDGVAYPAFGN